MEQYGLGRLQSPFDARDWNLADFIPLSMPAAMPLDVYWDFPSKSLNQKNTPHCVGFSMAAFGINSPVNTMYTNQDGHDFYYKCKIIDGRPGVEEGTYVRSGAKVLQNVGRIDNYAFARDITAIRWWLTYRGPLIVGTLWTEEMFLPDKDNVISIGGNVVGGHAYLLKEIKGGKYFGFQNSWGEDWGENGKAYISIEDFELLFKYNGEAMTAVELPHEPVIETPQHRCILMELLRKLFSRN